MNVPTKIIEFKNLYLLRKKNAHKKIVLAHGTFDFFHYGHFLHLKKAKSFGDILVVSLTADKFVNKGPGRPFYQQKIRSDYLASLKFVDYIIIANFKTGIEVIKKLKPDIYAKGNEYKNFSKDYTQQIVKEIKEINKIGGSFKTTNEITFSASNILNIFNEKFSAEANIFLNKFKKKDLFLNIFNKLKKLKEKKILLIGDAILDEYIFTSTMAKSPKEEIISVRELSRKKYLGGILATASQICDFPKKIDMLTILGNQKKEITFVKKNLNNNIKIINILDHKRKTILKSRYLEINKKQKLFQNNKLDLTFISQKTENKILNFLKKNKNKYDCVLVNDFGHGLLTDNIKNFLCRNIKNLCINVQTNSANLGYNLITNYNKCKYFTIDEPEARLATQQRFCDIKKIFLILKNKISFEIGSITFGDQGSHVFSKGKITHVPALSKNVVDTLGAGDAYFAYSSIYSIVSKNEVEISFIGNLAGAIKIQHLGHEKFIRKDDFIKYLKSVLA
jgi:rfaE bifunctional protein kinase chain/domain/rfaE bifunctional protein nucleotidyltransferase chain/domain